MKMNFENHQTQRRISQTVRAQIVDDKMSCIWVRNQDKKLCIKGEGWVESEQREKKKK